MNLICFQRTTGAVLLACAFLFTGCKKEPSELERKERLAAYGMVEGEPSEAETVEVAEEPVVEPEVIAERRKPEENEGKDLLDAELNQWTTFLYQKGGGDLDASDIFSVERRDGELVLDVSGECPAALMSVEEFEDYHLTFEYQWGENTSNKPRESGLLYHSFGKRGRILRAWMMGIELDISQEATGGIYALSGISANIASEKIDEKSSRYVPGAPLQKFEQGFAPGVSMRTIEQRYPYRCLPLEGQRADRDGWVRVDLYVVGDSAQHYVGGELVLELQDIGLHYEGKDRRELVKGKLQIQSEKTAISFRKIRIAEIDALPEI